MRLELLMQVPYTQSLGTECPIFDGRQYVGGDEEVSCARCPFAFYHDCKFPEASPAMFPAQPVELRLSQENRLNTGGGADIAPLHSSLDEVVLGVNGYKALKVRRMKLTCGSPGQHPGKPLGSSTWLRRNESEPVSSGLEPRPSVGSMSAGFSMLSPSSLKPYQAHG
ncbi:hypothetical protein AAY473_035059 [Plecturocebus cupreus]